jgi:hypothetical protein
MQQFKRILFTIIIALTTKRLFDIGIPEDCRIIPHVNPLRSPVPVDVHSEIPIRCIDSIIEQLQYYIKRVGHRCVHAAYFGYAFDLTVFSNMSVMNGTIIEISEKRTAIIAVDLFENREEIMKPVFIHMTVNGESNCDRTASECKHARSKITLYEHDAACILYYYSKVITPVRSELSI